MKSNKWLKLIGIFVLVKILFLSAALGLFQSRENTNEIVFDQAIERVNKSDINEVHINTEELAIMESNPLAYLFQLLFILFLISPPLIVLMLCLIYKELKKRNDLK